MSAEETEAVAEKIGSHLKGGEVIELVSDLGGGKTTFVRGLARGFDSHDKVASPTFTVSKLYKAGARELHHFDFYRLADAGVVAHELHDLVGDEKAVVVIEWADIVQKVLPEDRLTIRFVGSGETERQLELKTTDKLAYLLDGIC